MISGLGQRIVQLHPTLTCNLRCTHCYSASGPAERGALDLALLRDALTDLQGMGYEVVAISGGEPLVYRDLEPLLAHAKDLGMRTLVTTNGTLLDEARARRLRRLVDVLAISIDGPPAMHDAMRASPRAFAQSERGIASAASAGILFGISHALTSDSWEHLAWLADFAVDRGASLLQIHPLERSGRATALGIAPDDETLARAWLVTLAIATKYPDLVVQYDVFDRQEIAERPELVYATDDAGDDARAADLLGVMVVEPDGSVVPITYGIARDLTVCNLHRQRVAAAWPSYRANGYREFRARCRTIWTSLMTTCATLPFFNWHELLANAGAFHAIGAYRGGNAPG